MTKYNKEVGNAFLNVALRYEKVIPGYTIEDTVQHLWLCFLERKGPPLTEIKIIVSFAKRRVIDLMRVLHGRTGSRASEFQFKEDGSEELIRDPVDHLRYLNVNMLIEDLKYKDKEKAMILRCAQEHDRFSGTDINKSHSVVTRIRKRNQKELEDLLK